MNLRSGIKPHANCTYYKREQEMIRERALCRAKKGKEEEMESAIAAHVRISW